MKNRSAVYKGVRYAYTKAPTRYLGSDIYRFHTDEYHVVSDGEVLTMLGSLRRCKQWVEEHLEPIISAAVIMEKQRIQILALEAKARELQRSVDAQVWKINSLRAQLDNHGGNEDEKVQIST